MEGRGGNSVQPTCVRWQPLQRRWAAPAICSTACEGCMKGRNGRRVSPCQSYLGRNVGKTVISPPPPPFFRSHLEGERERESKKKERLMAEQSAANYLTALVGL